MVSSTLDKKTLVEQLFVRLPKIIQDQSEAREFISKLINLSSTLIVQLPNIGAVHSENLFSAVRQALKDGKATSIETIEHNSVTLTFEDGAIAIRRESSPAVTQRVHELALLSQDAIHRTAAFQYVLSRVGVTAPIQVYDLKEKISSLAIADGEMEVVLKELTSGVAALRIKAERIIRTSQPALDDLVPMGVEYYENLCGPRPKENISFDLHVQSELQQHRKTALQRDLIKGLELVLMGGLSSDLFKLEWFSDIDNDDLWRAIQKIDPWRDPISLLTAFHIAVGRIQDERFSQFASAAVSKLLESSFSCGNGYDGLELLPVLIDLVLCRLNSDSSFNVAQPNWKKMCAWMQGTILLRIIQDYNIDQKKLKEWAESYRSNEAIFTIYRDFQKEPMYRSQLMTKASLCSEIFGRLKVILNSERVNAEKIHLAELLDDAQSRIEAMDPLGWAMPGPLEGHKRPKECGGGYPAQDGDIDIAMIQSTDFDRIWMVLAALSQLTVINENVLEVARERMRQEIEAKGSKARIELSTLANVAIVAAVQEDVVLSDAVCSALCTAAALAANEEQFIPSAIQTLLIASAAHRDTAAWTMWLEKSLLRLACCTSAGGRCAQLRSLLRDLGNVFPRTLHVTDLAEAISSAGS